MSENGEPWHSRLKKKLGGNASDEEVVEFIEENVPTDENKIFDNKQDWYVRADRSEKDNENKADFVKTVSALANVIHPSKNRYVFVGFNDDREFTGSPYRSRELDDEHHIIEVDDARLMDILESHLNPCPQPEKYRINIDRDVGLIYLIPRIDRPPAVCTQEITKNAGNSVIVAEGTAYTRRSSSNDLMGHNEYRNLIQRREKAFTRKVQKFADELDQVVGIPAEDLGNLDLKVTSSDDGVPIKEIVTTEAAEDINEELTTAVKAWNSSGELLSNRRTIYKFYSNRELLDLDEEKAEFLFRSCLNNWIPGAEWLIRYEDGWNEMFSRIVSQNNYPEIVTLEKILLISGEKNLLKEISQETELSYGQSKAGKFAASADRRIDEKLKALNISETSSLLEEPIIPRQLPEQDTLNSRLEDIISKLLERDSADLRGMLRNVEHLRLANKVREDG